MKTVTTRVAPFKKPKRTKASDKADASQLDALLSAAGLTPVTEIQDGEMTIEMAMEKSGLPRGTVSAKLRAAVAAKTLTTRQAKVPGRRGLFWVFRKA